MPENELYSESEIAEIVRRAAELQEAGSAKGYLPGVTRDELTRMASEAGIEDSFLEQAIQERKAGTEPKKRRKWGEEIERVLPVEIAPENFDVITDSVKIMPVTTTKGVTSGGVTQVGRSVQGQVAAGWDNPHFKITSRSGRTKLQVWPSNTLASAMAIMWTVPLSLTPVIGHLSNNVFGGLAAIACAVGSVFTFRWFAQKAQQATSDVAAKMESSILQAAEDDSLQINLARPAQIQNEDEDVSVSS